MKLVGAALVLLAISGCSAEVVEDFTFLDSCHKFFADPYRNRSPPTRFTGSQYKQICQTLEGEVKYATYYDTANRIPVYSAYRFLGVDDCRNKSRRISWFIEPQLDQHNGDRNMTPQGKVKLRGTNQALNRDYKGSGYHRGHLAPVSHSNTQSCSNATFTLTNAAPQNRSFNEGQWRVTKKEVSDILSTNCMNVGLSAYVVTGVVPGNTDINNRVNVPSHFWTAYCCLDNNNQPQVSGGYYGANVNQPVNKVSVSELECFLTSVYGKGEFQVFGTEGCVKRRGRTKPFHSDRSRKRLRIAEEHAKDLVLGRVKPRSDYERVCLMRYVFASSRQRSPIMKHCAGNRFYSFMSEPKIDEFCATVFISASSRPISSDE